MLKTRLALLLILVMALMPATAFAQADDAEAPDAVETALIGQLCAATAAEAAEQAACISAVSLALAEIAGTEPLGEQDPLGEALSRVRELDLQAALDEISRNAQGLEIGVDADLQAAIDEAVANLEGLELGVDIDLQAAIDEATAAAMAATEEIDLAAAVDEALAEAQAAIEDAGVRAALDDTLMTLEQGVDDARAVAAEAQRWAQQNTDAVCRGGSLSLGTTVGLAVFALTGVEWLGLQAFWATERFSNGLCGDIVE
jgi:aminopeptidase N